MGRRRLFSLCILGLCLFIFLSSQGVLVSFYKMRSELTSIMINPYKTNSDQHSSDAMSSENKLFIKQFIDEYPEVDKTSIKLFLQIKTLQYDQRRRIVNNYCKNSTQQFGKTITNETFVIDEVDKVSYCMIPKVASSTWCTHFAHLGNASSSLLNGYRNALQKLVFRLFPPLPVDKILAAVNKTQSIVIVRHPMSRMASVYQQKFVDLAKTAWSRICSHIVKHYRKFSQKVPDIDPEIPQPEEVIRYIISTFARKHSVNVHWKLQFESCPFCSLNFTIYAKSEEMAEDSLYFILNSNLTTKLNISARFNPSKNNEYNFWSMVPGKIIRQFVTVYLADFTMAGYSARSYLDNLNIIYDPNIITI